MMDIQIKGIENLSELEKSEAKEILDKGCEKLKRSIKNDFILKVVIKEYFKEGKNSKRKKYSVNAEVSGAVKLIASSEEWDLKKVLHETIDRLCTEAEHKYRASEQGKI